MGEDGFLVRRRRQRLAGGVVHADAVRVQRVEAVLQVGHVPGQRIQPLAIAIVELADAGGAGGRFDAGEDFDRQVADHQLDGQAARGRVFAAPEHVRAEHVAIPLLGRRAVSGDMNQGEEAGYLEHAWDLPS